MKRFFRIMIGLGVIIGIAGFGAVASAADAGSGETAAPAANEGFLIAAEPAAEEHPSDQPKLLSLRDFLLLVRERNEQISYQGSEWAVSREAVKGAHAIFEPALVGSYQYQEDKRRNTVQDLVSQGYYPYFQERSQSYQAAIEGQVPTGAKVRLGYTLKDFVNSIDARYYSIYGVEREAQTVFGASVVQPLLKGRGVAVNTALIRVAEADSDIAYQTYRGQMMRVMSDAIAAYWELSLAREKLVVRKESELNAEGILKQNIARAAAGKIADTEVLEARAGLALRKSLVNEALQAIVSAMNITRSFFSSSTAQDSAEIVPAERLAMEEVKPDFTQSLSTAFKHRAEYLASLRKIEREDIKLIYAENQVWPQLDLKGSYNMNGLDDRPRASWSDAWRRDYETWSVGMELRVPLGGDKKGRSELEATKQRKRQALLELKAVEVSLANAVDTSVRGVSNAWVQARHFADIVEMTRQLLDAEIARFEAGKSNSRILLEREENLNKAKEAYIESLVKYRRALFQLDMAEGTLLVNQGIDVMEVGLK
jgi:outer membrane protein TolC